MNLVRTGGKRSSIVLVDVTTGGAGRLEVDATRFLLELEDFFLSKKKKKEGQSALGNGGVVCDGRDLLILMCCAA